MLNQSHVTGKLERHHQTHKHNLLCQMCFHLPICEFLSKPPQANLFANPIFFFRVRVSIGLFLTWYSQMCTKTERWKPGHWAVQLYRGKREAAHKCGLSPHLNSVCAVKARQMVFRLVASTPCSAVMLSNWWLHAVEVSNSAYVSPYELWRTPDFRAASNWLRWSWWGWIDD